MQIPPEPRRRLLFPRRRVFHNNPPHVNTCETRLTLPPFCALLALFSSSVSFFFFLNPYPFDLPPALVLQGGASCPKKGKAEEEEEEGRPDSWT